MSNPTVSAALNKASYTPGEVMTLTVTYADADTQSYPLTITVTDALGGMGSATVTVVRADKLTVDVSDPTGRVWTAQSDSGGVAVFTALA